MKVGGDLSRSRLKGAISADEILNLDQGQDATFVEVDPREGFCVRNFQIQATKMAMLSDIVLYGDEEVQQDGLRTLAKKFSVAQSIWRASGCGIDDDYPKFNTFIISSKLKVPPLPKKSGFTS